MIQQTNVTGDKFRWDITNLATRWWRKETANSGVLLSDATTEPSFRGVRLGSREGEVYRLPRAVQGPRLALKWTIGVMPGDFTGNGCVDCDDLALLMAVVRGQAIAGDGLAPKLNVNNDAKVDIADARKLATMFSNPSGAPCN